MKNELFMKPYGLSWAISIMLLCHVDGKGVDWDCMYTHLRII